MKLSSQIYWALFVVAFLGVAIWESFRPGSRPTVSTGRRWGHHALLFAVSAALVTALLRLLPVGAASLVQSSGIGILNRPVLPFALRCIVTVLLLDFIQYWLHRAFHASRPLWRVHEIHHSDPDYDVSTGTRFHPLELLPIQGIRFAVVLLLAPPPVAVLFSELLGLLLNFVVHANASFTPGVEAMLRAFFITPDLHRIHHSEDPSDYDRNFGQTFSWWDRLFGTYVAAPRSGIVSTGVRGIDGSRQIRVSDLLTRPFKRA